MLVSISGVVQKPNAGTGQPSEGFALDGANIIFAAPPPSGADYFIVTIGAAVSIGTPTDETITLAKFVHGTSGNNGKYLRSNNGADPSWESIPAGIGGATGVDFNDDVEVRFGTDNDLVVKHSGSAAFVTNSLGAFNLNAGAGLDITTGGDITIGAGHPIIIEAITGNAGGHVQFREGTTGGTNAVSIKGPETIASDYSIVLPNAAPTANGQALTATTAGVASWANVSSTTADGCLYENDQSITNNYTIASGKGAHAVGPLAISATLTINGVLVIS